MQHQSGNQRELVHRVTMNFDSGLDAEAQEEMKADSRQGKSCDDALLAV
jgi:hypothetical protein